MVNSFYSLKYTGAPIYKDDISINSDGIPLCPKGFPMKQAAVEPRKGRIKYRCPKISYKGGIPHCTCDGPCSDAKYGRNVRKCLKTRRSAK